MDRAALTRRASLLVLAAIAAEVCTWILGAGNATETFAFFRVQAHLGVPGFVLTAAVGLAAAALPHRRLRHPWRVLVAASVLVNLPFVDVAQGQPDTAMWFTHAQRVARDPTVLLRWSDAVWSGEEARFHKPFPLVPAVYGAAFAVFGESPRVAGALMAAVACALPLAVAWAASEKGRPAVLAGLATATVPLLAAQTGWFLADIPLCLAVVLAWGVLVRGGLGGGALAGLPALATKVAGLPLVAAPLATVAFRRRPWALAILAVLAGILLGCVYPPRLRAPAPILAAFAAMLLHLRPALWIPALAAATVRDRLGSLVLGALALAPLVAIYSPPEHAARYALPLAAAAAIGASRVAPRAAAFAVGSGLVLAFGGYRPILVHNQAEGIREATALIVGRGASAIEVWTDTPGTTFGVESVAALVDYYAPVPVRVGGALSVARAGAKRRWWEFVEPVPWRAPGPADGVLLALYGADERAFEARNPNARFVDEVAPHRTSSLIFPRALRVYAR